MAYSKSQVDRAGRYVADQERIWAGEGREKTEPTRAFSEASEILEWWRDEHAKPLSRVAGSLRYHVAREGNPVVTQRLKKVPTIASKLLREPNMKLSRMADIGGLRAVLPSQVAVYKAASRLRKNWTIVKFRDYVAEPKADGYRAIHLVNRNRGRLIEVQLRTPLQDSWANLVETLSRKAVPGLKFGEGSLALRELLRNYGRVFAEQDEGLIPGPEVLAWVLELLNRLPGASKGWSSI